MNNIIDSIVEKISREHPELIINATQERKNNGVLLNAIMIREKSKTTTMAPIIYIDNFINNNWSVDRISDTVLKIYNENKKGDCAEWIIKLISDYDGVREKLSLRIVHYERNEKKFRTLPHKKFLDLGVFVVIRLLNDGSGEATTQVTNELLTLWNKSFDEVYNDAMQNLYSETPVCISMGEFFEKMHFQPSYCVTDNFYILTNTSGIYGASVMLNLDFINGFAEKMCSDLVMFPSSVNEILVLSMNDTDDLQGLSDIVKEVNLASIDAQEILSDHIYVFRRGKNWEF